MAERKMNSGTRHRLDVSGAIRGGVRLYLGELTGPRQQQVTRRVPEAQASGLATSTEGIKALAIARNGGDESFRLWYGDGTMKAPRSTQGV